MDYNLSTISFVMLHNRSAQIIFDSLEEQMSTGHLCDILFYNDSGTVWAHSCILAGFSPFFSRLFSLMLSKHNHWSLKQPMQINLSSITKCKSDSKSNCLQCLAQVVKFIYTGKIKPNLFHLHHLFILSERLENDDLHKMCKQFRRDHSLLKANVISDKANEPDLKTPSNGVSVDSQNEKLKRTKLCTPHNDRIVNNCVKDSVNSSVGFSKNCNICSFISDDATMFNAHSKVFHSNEYKCLYCEFSHKNIAIFVGHVEKQCDAENSRVCSLCLFRSDSSENLLSHVKVHLNDKPFKCASCERSFDKRSLWLKHTKSHIFKKTFSCPSCELKFNTEVECSKHNKLIHSVKKHVCQECGFAAAFPYVLEKHKLKHRKLSLICEQDKCGFRTSSEILLIRHKSVHKTSKKEKADKCKDCSVCKMKFTLHKNLIRHMKVHKSVQEKLKCQHCNYETFRKDKLNEHVSNKHHGENSKESINTESPLEKTSERIPSNTSDSSKIESPDKDMLPETKKDNCALKSLSDQRHFSRKHNTLLMNDEGDISIVNTNEVNSVALTLRNIGNLTGSITLDERTGILTMNNINSGSVFLNETTGELTYINLENDKNIELNYFNSDSIKQVDNFKAPQIPKHALSSEVTKLDEFTGEIIKVLPSSEDYFTPEQEFDSFDMDVNEESLDGFDDFDELLFDVFNENDVEYGSDVVLPNDQTMNKTVCAMPHLDESTGLLTFDKTLSQTPKSQDMWNSSFTICVDNNSQMRDNNDAYQLLLDEVTGVLHD